MATRIRFQRPQDLRSHGRMTKGKFSVLPKGRLVDRVQFLTLAAPEVTVLLGSMPFLNTNLG